MAKIEVIDVGKLGIDFGAYYRTRYQSAFQYAASFPPGVPATYINMFTKPGDMVIEPFAGKGTTALQALIMGRKTIANDLSKVAVTYTHSRVRTPPRSDIYAGIHELKSQLPSVKVNIHDVEELLWMYHPDTLLRILQSREILMDKSDDISMFLKAFIMSTLYGSGDRVLCGDLPGSFPLNLGSLAKVGAERKTKPPFKDFFAVLQSKIEYSMQTGVPTMKGDVLNMDSTKLDKVIEPNSANVCITSPPYINLMAYGEKSWIQQWFAGENYKEYDQLTKELGSCSGNLDSYFLSMSGVLRAMYNVLKDNSACVFVVGGSRSKKETDGELFIPMKFAEVGSKVGFTPRFVFTREFHSAFRSMFDEETRDSAGTDYRDCAVVFFKGEPKIHIPIAEAWFEISKEVSIEDSMAGLTADDI